MVMDISTLGRHVELCDIDQQITENIGFDDGCGSAVKAQKFIAAARLWLLRVPQSTTKGGTSSESVSFDHATIKRLLDDAISVRDRLAANTNSPGGYKHFSMECYRG